TFSNPELTDIQNTEKINQTIETLTNLSSNELMAVICHPYMDDTLFRCWPTKHITNLITIVNKVSKNGNSSIASQLAGVLINRGLYYQISRLNAINKPISLMYLIGNARFPLDESSFLSTLDYMNTHDPEHVSEFLNHFSCNYSDSETHSSQEQKTASQQ
ncbi:unnamed protein product, partial [Schistosoma turkestanicum]